MANKKWTGKECFAHFGTKPRNVQWSWSAKSEDGQTVVVRLWQDRFQNAGRYYRIEDTRTGTALTKQLGRQELMENLQHAIDHCEGKVRVIIIIAKDKLAVRRSIKESFPHDGLVMRVSNLDPISGTADLHRVE